MQMFENKQELPFYTSLNFYVSNTVSDKKNIDNYGKYYFVISEFNLCRNNVLFI